MKKIFLPTLFLGLLAGLVLFLPSCSETHAEGPAISATPQAKAPGIPQLMGRTEGLGSAKERAFVAGKYDEQVARLRSNVNDGDAWLSLVELFINEARITGEHPYYYPHALDMLRNMPKEALASDDQKFKAAYLEASIQLSLHDFTNALATGERARAIFPYHAGIYGVLIDAHVELGNYSKAVELSDKMVSLRPDLRSYARISYLREIHGEYEGAIDAMKMAVSAGMPGYEQTAWCRLTLGKLYENYGDLEQAKLQYQMLLLERPDYPFAYAGLSRVEQKMGNLEEGEKLLEKAISLIPEVGFYQQKAGLLAAKEMNAEAMALYPEILSMMQEDSDAGHNMDLEVGLVHLELGNAPEKALASIQKAAKGRMANIEINAAFASVYFAMGEYEMADGYMNKAMATRTMNPEYLGLAGLIRIELGSVVEGKGLLKRSLELNPFQDYFWTGKVKEALG